MFESPFILSLAAFLAVGVLSWLFIQFPRRERHLVRLEEEKS